MKYDCEGTEDNSEIRELFPQVEGKANLAFPTSE